MFTEQHFCQHIPDVARFSKHSEVFHVIYVYSKEGTVAEFRLKKKMA